MKYKCLLFILLTINQLQAQTGCPDCVINLPVLPEDTIFLSKPSDGEVGVYYDGDLSFRMPKTTDPVNANDPGTPAGLDISEITILNIVNLPPGLSWEASQTTFDTSEETDGCVKFCGTPLVSDTFHVGVVIEAQVSILTQTASFSFDFYIAPAASNNDGFSATNTQGCGALAVDFSNNVPSEGEDGFSYIWDFGNGNSTTDEQPMTQNYDEPGEYEVTYEATIDTVGFVLTSIDILQDDCGDLIGEADIFIRIKNPSGETIFSTDPISDTPIPINFPTNINLTETGEYKLEVRDQDPFGTEDCGNIYFTQSDNSILTDGNLEVQFNILHPIFTVTSTDTIIVLEEPELPQLTLDLPNPLCTGTLVELFTDYEENIQWFKDSSLIFGAIDSYLEVTTSGVYWVQYTAGNGCQVISEAIEIDYLPAPAIPVHSNADNLLSLNDEDILPENYAAQWYLNNEPIPFADELFWCMEESGSYTLRIFDEDNGCFSSYNFSYVYNSDFECNVTNTEEALAEQIDLELYPNPSNGLFNVNFTLQETSPVFMAIYDLTGQVIWKKEAAQLIDFSEELNFMDRNSGVYFLRILVDDELITRKLILK